jgi:hypothetical protein
MSNQQPTFTRTIYEALSAILPNTWPHQLPPNPTYPVIVFDVDTTPEKGWSTGGAGAAYSQNEVSVLTIGDDLDVVEALQSQIAAALAGVEGFLSEEGSGNAEFEEDPQAYGRFQTVIIRSRNI